MMSEFPQQDLYLDDPRADVAPFVPAGCTSALDVGCGRGGFGRTLRTALGEEARIVGIDPVPTNVANASVNHGFDHVYEGSFPAQLPGGERDFDLITFIDVLEHLFDPWAALRATQELLTDRGKVLALIPSIQVWDVVVPLLRGRWDYADTGTLDRTHIRFFTKATMLDMFDEAGFEVLSCTGVNSRRPPIRPIRRNINLTWFRDLHWLPRVIPDSQWLHFALVGRPRR